VSAIGPSVSANAAAVSPLSAHATPAHGDLSLAADLSDHPNMFGLAGVCTEIKRQRLVALKWNGDEMHD